MTSPTRHAAEYATELTGHGFLAMVFCCVSLGCKGESMPFCRGSFGAEMKHLWGVTLAERQSRKFGVR